MRLRSSAERRNRAAQISAETFLVRCSDVLAREGEFYWNPLSISIQARTVEVASTSAGVGPRRAAT
jgi:hypothetical protein